MLTKKELISTLRLFEESNGPLCTYMGSEIRLCDNDSHVTVIYYHLYGGGYESDPDMWEDVDVFSLLDIADAFSKNHSAYWQEMAKEIKEWYYAHVKWDEFSKSKECLDFMCEHFKDLSFTEAGKLMKSVFYTKQQLYKTQSQIKDINNELDSGNLSEEDIINAMEAWRDLDIDKTHLEWELNILLNK